MANEQAHTHSSPEREAQRKKAILNIFLGKPKQDAPNDDGEGMSLRRVKYRVHQPKDNSVKERVITDEQNRLERKLGETRADIEAENERYRRERSETLRKFGIREK